MNWPAETRAGAGTGPRRHSGFTLIEMLIVLAILGMALGLLVNRGPLRSERLTQRDTAIGLAEALRETRGRAIAENRPVALTLNIKDHFYRIGDSKQAGLPRTLPLVLKTTTGEVKSEEEGDIRFDPDGSSTGGRIELGQRDRMIQIGVDWLTGRVSIIYGAPA